MKRRVFSLVLAFVMVFTLFICTGTAKAAQIIAGGNCGENLTWTLTDEGKLTISGEGGMPDLSADSAWRSYSDQIRTVIIENGVTIIGSDAFSGCSNLVNVTIPESVKQIESFAFYNCKKLSAVTFPSGLTRIWNHAFEQCSSLTEISIPEGVMSIERFAFNYCTSLKKVTIAEGVVNIMYMAFGYCTNLESIEIPESVTHIGNYAFIACDSLTAIHVAPGNKTFCDVDGVVFSKDKTMLCVYPGGKSGTSYTIPSGTKSIGYGAFSGCLKLNRIIIPSGVTTIEDEAFFDCEGLTAVTFPKTVTSIGAGAFWRCTSLTSVTIPEGITRIENGVFAQCESLAGVTIPESVTSIGKEAFSECGALNDVYYAGSEEQWNAITTEEYNEPLRSAAIHYNGSTDPIVIANGVCGDALTWVLTSDGTLTISGTGKMDDGTKYTLSPWQDSVERIKTVVIKDGTTYIGEYAFLGCTNLTKVTIPESVTSIGYKAFYFCMSLTSIVIPESVTYIGDSAFFGCALQNVYYPGTQEQWNAITIENNNEILAAEIIHFSGEGMYTPGDVDENRQVNTTDVILVRRFIAGGYNVEINANAADVEGNGVINTTDVILMRRAIAGGYGVELKPGNMA